jgi:hypothetical protein
MCDGWWCRRNCEVFGFSQQALESPVSTGDVETTGLLIVVLIALPTGVFSKTYSCPPQAL